MGQAPNDLAITPDGSFVYVCNSADNTVSIINTMSQTVVSTIAAGTNPMYIAIKADGSSGYVVNTLENTVTVLTIP